MLDRSTTPRRVTSSATTEFLATSAARRLRMRWRHSCLSNGRDFRTRPVACPSEGTLDRHRGGPTRVCSHIHDNGRCAPNITAPRPAPRVLHAGVGFMAGRHGNTPETNTLSCRYGDIRKTLGVRALEQLPHPASGHSWGSTTNVCALDMVERGGGPSQTGRFTHPQPQA